MLGVQFDTVSNRSKRGVNCHVGDIVGNILEIGVSCHVHNTVGNI